MSEEIPNITFYGYENDEEREITLSCVYVVCPRCQGRGTHTNPSIDGNGITQSEMHELGYQFQEDYCNGMYDVSCYECKGKRVVPAPCEYTNSKEDLAAYEKHLQEEAEYRAECEMERRMGC